MRGARRHCRDIGERFIFHFRLRFVYAPRRPGRRRRRAAIACSNAMIF